MTKTKRIVFLAAVVLGLGFNTLAAQTSGWYVLGGPALTDLSVPVVSGHKEFSFGFLAGAGYEAPLGGSASLRLQLLFKTGGTHIDLNSTSDMTYSGYALAVPVLLKLKLGSGSAPYVLAGGYAAAMFSPRVELDFGEESTETSIPGQDVNSFAYGLAAGAGYAMDIGKKSVFIEAFYMYGLSNLAKTGSDKVRASSVNLAVGYRF